ncbi:diguanylate cyclase domain-containing protein [Stutzerimonas azotifigens]|uniref:diguanylate cyclase n=1 Tax=Stutzerimonas azotifigens TaxID=291995 RepID=A0ABR5YZ53_9GAMM|nr:diguanylate cyclase [Stutzerimonas azotifigens]MBA1273209.1 diguanylate cyclase [Stutzerimonas azotifigens]
MGRPEPLDRAASSPAPLRQSLGRRLVLATLGFCLLFTVLAVGVRSWFAWGNAQYAMESELTLIDQVFRNTLSKAIWEMDSEALTDQLDSVSRAAPVGRVELQLPRTGREPEILTRSSGQNLATQRAPTLSRTLIYEPYPGAREVVGRLILEGSESLLWERLYHQLIDIVVTQLIQSLLLAGLIMWMFNQTVTVHVRVIARHLAQLSPASLGKRLRLERSARRQDELSLLEAGINKLQAKLSTYLERQRQDELDLAAHRDRLAELVQERTAELRAANARLEELSRSDPLTGLANRRQFDELKDVEFRRAQRLNQPLTVLMCDVDHFKRYNDTHGHAAGDRCLKVVAETLTSTFGRAGELVARLGGEEFVVLLPGSDQDSAMRAAEHVQQRLAERALSHGDSPVAPHVTLSIGLAAFDAETMDRFDLLLHRADEALYRAKAQGRNRVAD